MTPHDCPHENDVKNCISVRRTGPPARCMNCKPGRENEEKAREVGCVEPARAPGQGLSAWRSLGRKEGEARRKLNNVIQTTTSGIRYQLSRPNENDCHHEKEENRMDATKKDLVLRKIQEHKAITRGALAGTTRLKKEEVESIAKTLEAEGKIKAWPGKRSDSLVYTTPDLPNPLEEIDGKKPAAKKKAAPRASGPAGPRKSQAIPRNPIPAQVPVKVPPKNGGGSAEDSLKDLPSFRRIQNYNLSLTTAMVHGDPEGIDDALEEIACAALDWRRERRATA